MCYHLDRRGWEALGEETVEATEATDEAEPELDEGREALAPTADD